MKTFSDLYANIISIENLLLAWEEFVVNKNKRTDMRIFAQKLFPNILDLHNDLINSTYHHANYEKFNITDPKPRIIHKATVRDRLLHHAIYRILYPLFDQTFIFDSYSCRQEKGTHRGFRRLAELARGRKTSFPKTPLFFARSPEKFSNYLELFLYDFEIFAIIKNNETAGHLS